MSTHALEFFEKDKKEKWGRKQRGHVSSRTWPCVLRRKAYASCSLVVSQNQRRFV
jgi:hypothetical protein